MVGIAILQGILFIVSSGMACHGLCCGDDNYDVRPLDCLLRSTNSIETVLPDIMHNKFVLIAITF